MKADPSETKVAPRKFHYAVRGVALVVIGAIVYGAWNLPDLETKAAVTQGLSQASAGKQAVIDYWAENRRLPSSNSEAGYDDSHLLRDYSHGVEIVESGKVVLTFSDCCDARAIKGYTMILAPAEAPSVEGLHWTCTEGTLPARYRPSSCK
jgi:type IV pilus assembly protein PilA